MPIDDHDLGPFPDPTPPGDADSNSALTQIVARVQAWTGSAWKRLRTGAQTAANSLSVVLATDTTVPVAGIDDTARQRQVAVDNLGEAVSVPGIFNAIYLRVLRTVTSESVCVGNVTYLLDPDKWSKVTLGAGSVVFDPTFGEARLSVSGTAGDEALLIFNTGIPVASGHGQQARFAHRVDTPLATGVLREWGVFSNVGTAALTSEAIGFYIEDGEFGIFFQSSTGAVLKTPQSAFLIDKLDGNGPSGVTITPADLIHSTEYSIWLDWKLIYYVGDKPVTYLDLGTPSTSPVLAVVGNPPVFRLTFRIKNTSTTGVTSNTWSHIALGDLAGVTEFPSDHFAEPTLPSVVVQSGETVPVFTIRAAATLGGVTMGKRIFPKRIAVDMTGPGQLSLYYGISTDIVLTGASFALPSNAPGSGAEVDFSATAITVNSTAKAVSSRSIAANEETLIDLTETFGSNGLALTVRGDGTLVMLTAVVTNTSGGPCDATVRVFEWREVV